MRIMDQCQATEGVPDRARLMRIMDQCQATEGVPDRARLMRIMGIQATEGVESITLPDGRYTKSRRQTLRELDNSFSRVCWRRSRLERTRGRQPDSICCSRAGLGTGQKGH
jgi:hypothetical protein